MIRNMRWRPTSRVSGSSTLSDAVLVERGIETGSRRYLYHGTSQCALPGIVRKGLRPRRGYVKRWWYLADAHARRPFLFVTENRRVAEGWSKDAALYSSSPSIVLRIDTHHPTVHATFYKDPAVTAGSSWRGRAVIPPKAICAFFDEEPAIDQRCIPLNLLREFESPPRCAIWEQERRGSFHE